MAHVSHKLSNAFEGALAGGGDPATSPLYVFGPFLKLIVIAGVAPITFGASIWLVVFTVFMVSTMYRLVMRWVVDGSGGSGLSEEEFGGWAVKVNAGITFVEYTLTFLVSMAALVTFMADRWPVLNETLLGLQARTYVAIVLSILTGWLVNRGPKTAARAFGPATLAVLALLWAMIIATVWKLGFRLPDLDLRAFSPAYLNITFGGYARILALMTGIEIFANLVAAYQGTAQEKSRKAFGSLVIIMGTTSLTMLIVGPAILQLSDPGNELVSVFTQTMDQLLPAPLPWLGTLVGIIVLGSAAAASAQGLQNLALGLRYRHYIPSALGQRNKHDVADKPVWIEVGLVALCFVAFGTHEETYLAIYAAGVFILLSMTGWACAKRLIRQPGAGFTAGTVAALGGTVLASLLTSAATVLIFVERFAEGAWTYLVFLPLLYVAFGYFRAQRGAPTTLDDHLGRILGGQYLLPYQREARPEDETKFERILVPLDGSHPAEQGIFFAQYLGQAFGSRVTLLGVKGAPGGGWKVGPAKGEVSGAESVKKELQSYLGQLVWRLEKTGYKVDYTYDVGPAAEIIENLARDTSAQLIVMSTHGSSGVEKWFLSDTARKVLRHTTVPVLLIRPTEDWRSHSSQFGRLLVSLDGSEGSEQVLRFARAVAGKFGSEIVLLSVPEAEPEEAAIREYLERVAEALRGRGLKARALVTGSGAARTIVQVSETEQADLIMMASRGRGSTATEVVVGSVTDRVVQSTQVPVLVVPITRAH